jgi:hypothetical protein
MSQENISPQEFGALQADVKNLAREISLLRKDMAQVNAVINQSRGGIYVVMFVAGLIGSAITLGIKKLLGL